MGRPEHYATVEALEPVACSDPFTRHVQGDDTAAPGVVLGTHQVTFGARMVGYFWVGPTPFGPLCEACAREVAKRWNAKTEHVRRGGRLRG